MYDIIEENMLWFFILAGTALLYGLNYFVSLSRKKTQTVYRISNESLAKSKQVMIRLLKLVEDGQNTVLDERSLPFQKDDIKSAGKILGFFYLRQRLPEDYQRVKEGFIALSRFQDIELPPNKLEALMKRDAAKLKLEFEAYIRRSPVCEPKKGAPEACTTIDAKSEPQSED